jgi:hypothetical protein
MIIIIWFFYKLLNRNKKVTPEIPATNYRRYYAALFAGVLYMLFSSTTFYGQRYIIPVFPIVATCIAIISYYNLFRKREILIFGGVVGLSALSFFYLNSPKFNYDNDMSYIRSINSSKKTIKYMLDRNMLVQNEFSATMPIIFALADERFGYLPKDTIARHSRALHVGSKYAVQVIPGTPIENPDNRPLKLLDEWYDQDIITRIYQVLPLDTIQINK